MALSTAGELGNEGDKALHSDFSPDGPAQSGCITSLYNCPGAVQGSGWETNIHNLQVGISDYLTALNTAGTITGLHTTLLLGGGVEPWMSPISAFQAMVQDTLTTNYNWDYQVIHSHLWDTYAGSPPNDTLLNAVYETTQARTHGKALAYNEMYPYYQLPGDAASVPTIESRNNFTFWNPLDYKWFKFYHDLLNYRSGSTVSWLCDAQLDRWFGQTDFFNNGTCNGHSGYSVCTAGQWDGLNNSYVNANLAAFNGGADLQITPKGRASLRAFGK